MRIEAVTVCVDYADFAQHALPANKKHFDAYTVVTAPDDRETRALCDDLGIHCSLTVDLRPYNGIAKARAINLGMAGDVVSDRWMVLVDADIVLPAHTRLTFETIGLDEGCLYGIDREPMTRRSWNRRGVPRPAGPVIAQAPSGVWRIGHQDMGGWWPLGFFQMWHPRSTGISCYPTELSLSARASGRTTDREFAALWPRERRRFIPELMAAHLVSRGARPKENWMGRITARFDERGEAYLDFRDTTGLRRLRRGSRLRGPT
jgi:hypothetical protein